MSSRNREYIDFLKQRFDEKRFIEFTSDLLNLSPDDINKSINEFKPEQKQFKKIVDYYKFIANYTSNSDRIGIFIVKLTNEGSQKARTQQRTLISLLLGKYNLDASIVAFYQDNDSSWRLSFVKKELNYGENGPKIELTPAKRYSYLVGENESVHTAQEYLFNLLNIENRKITLSDIEKVFDVEKVTKKFFEEYKDKYLKLKEYLDGNKDFITESKNCDFTSEEFAKKLMGQIVFLYFLQKKGWLGVQIVPDELSIDDYNELSSKLDSVCNNLLQKYYIKEDKVYRVDKKALKTEIIKENITNFVTIFKDTKYDMPWGSGDKKFVRNMFKKSRIDHKDNFFDEYLEPFFYTGLNEKRDNQYFALFNCKIPFLNGGLFEPINNYRWSSAQFNIPDEMFSNDKNDGILDIFDLYNFTIDEEEPLEKDIAVDPEMLGKIFEKLLDVNDRKSTGAFYTPRTIVHNMCQESIANYLVNKIGVKYEEVINFIKYGEIISQYDWSIFNNELQEFEIGPTIYENILKLDDALINVKIADLAVGSGAFPLGMVNEIVKLRNNLQTYILIQNDLKIINLDDLYNTKHLIDDLYELKLQTIENCIYAVDIEPSAVDIAKLRLWLSLIVDYPSDREPQPLPNLDYKIMQGNSLLDEYEGIQLFSDKLIDNFLKKYKRNTEQKNVKEIKIQFNLLNIQTDIDKQMKQLIAYQTELFKTSNSKLKKELKEKIENIQIGIICSSLSGNSEKTSKIKELLQKNQKPWFIWKLEFFEVFKNNGGFDIIIGNPPYGIVFDNIKKEYEKKYEIFKRNNDLYVAFYQLAFMLANSKGIISLITPNTYLNGDYFKKVRQYIKSNSRIIEIIDYKTIPIFDDPTVYVAIGIFSKLKKQEQYTYKLKVANNDLDNLSIYNVKNDINDDSPIKVVSPIFSKINSNKDYYLEEHYEVKDVGFNYWSIGNKKQRNGNSIGSRVLYSGVKLNDKDIPFLKGRDIYKYYKEQPTNYLRYNYDSYLNKEIDVFRFSEDVMKNKNKIIYRQTANKIIATVDYDGIYNDKTVHCIIPKESENNVDIKYILALLNSRLFTFLYREISQENEGRAFSQVKTVYVKKLPIIIPDDKKIREIVSLVDEIFSKKHDFNVNTIELEEKIDLIIYDIYSINEEEKKQICQQLSDVV